MVGPLPFCVPQVGEMDSVGTQTSYPFTLNSLDKICHWIWRVRSWQLEISGLANEFANYDDFTFEFANHEKTGLTPPTSVVELITGYGLNLTHEFTLLDNFGQPNEFRLRIQGLDAALRHTEPSAYYPHLVVELDLLLPGNVPPEEVVFRSTAGTIDAGELLMDGAACGLYTGFPGQITDTWIGDIRISPLDMWSFEP